MIQEKEIKSILDNLPRSPGIYKMLDGEGRVIYVGKANDISKRIRQYFQKDYQHSTRTRKLLENVTNIESIGVDSELEAIILEHNLIKQLQPKYNIIMKDDKNYVYIKITKEDFPRIQIVRKIEKDNAKYIGPKTAAHKVKETFKVLKKIFPFRHCNLDINLIQEKPLNKEGKAEHDMKIGHKTIKYPCLDFYIKRCIAPCIGRCNVAEYREIINNVEKFLEGKADEILEDLKKKMLEYANNKDFERAAKARDQIQKIEAILEKQKVQDHEQEDSDIINYCITQERAYFNLFQIRDGKLIGQENFILAVNEEEELNSPQNFTKENQEILEAFITQYYQLATDIPRQILVPHDLENKESLEEFLAQQSLKKPKLIVPKIGTKNKLLEMSLNNARIYADRNKPKWKTESELTIKAAEELQILLSIPKPLKRIECYDISHLSGTDTVGSMVVFENGVPKNSFYRKFHLRTVQGKPDDFKSMEEVLFRRFSKIALEASQRDYKFRKATKKDWKFIDEQSKKEGLNRSNDNYKAFYLLEKDKKIVGFAALEQKSEKVSKIKAVWIAPEERGKKLGYKLLKSIVQKAKTKRVYLFCFKELLDYYLIAGFELIKEVPEELKKEFVEAPKILGAEVICLAYDKKKHKEDESFKQIPDLIIIDGGKGQLSSATKILNKLNLKISYISLAKKLEEIFHPDMENPILLERHNEALKLLQRARDEAHRFAISYNKNLRKKRLRA